MFDGQILHTVDWNVASMDLGQHVNFQPQRFGPSDLLKRCIYHENIDLKQSLFFDLSKTLERRYIPTQNIHAMVNNFHAFSVISKQV